MSRIIVDLYVVYLLTAASLSTHRKSINAPYKWAKHAKSGRNSNRDMPIISKLVSNSDLDECLVVKRTREGSVSGNDKTVLEH